MFGPGDQLDDFDRKDTRQTSKTVVVPVWLLDEVQSLLRLEGHDSTADVLRNHYAAAPQAPVPSGDGVLDVATWIPLDDNGLAEVRVNGQRITSMPSYAGAEEVAERINRALQITADMRLQALSGKGGGDGQG